MPRSRSFLVVLLLGAFFVGGCGGRQHYVVQVEPRSDGVHRDLVCWREEEVPGESDRLGRFPLARLQEVAALYGADLPDEASAPVRHHFSATFPGDYGTEVGGRGHFTRTVTSLGSVTTWSESQGGEADPVAMRDRRLAALDRVLEHGAAFVFHDQGRTAETEALVAFLRSDLRDVLRGWVAFLWTVQTLETLGVDDSVVDVTMQAHVKRLLVERGILEPIESAGKNLDLDAVGEGIIRRAALAMGGQAGEDPPEVLKALLHEEDLRERLTSYAKTLPGHQARVRAWAAEKETAAAPPPSPDPLEVFREDLGACGLLQGVPFLEDDDVLALELRLPVPPVETNGTWDPPDGTVRWAATVPPTFGLPLLCTATWAEPDVARQERLFGAVVLEGELLVAYVQAHHRLTNPEAERWDGFVDALAPGPGLVARVEALSETLETVSEAPVTPIGRVACCLLDGLRDAFPEQVPRLPSPPLPPR